MSALSAQNRISLELVAITTAYAAGATVPIFVLALLGQRASGGLARVRSGGAAVRRLSGVVLVAAAWLFTTSIPTELAAATPGYVSSLQSVERSHNIAGDLRHLTESSANSPAAVAAGLTPTRCETTARRPTSPGSPGGSTPPGRGRSR